jgi:hypothetical protein
MTHDEALTLQEGDILVASHTYPPMAPQAVREVYHTKTGPVMVRFKMKREWTRAELYERPPAGSVWDGAKQRWVVRA